ncbi:MAG: NTP transferase domain-containing protein [candidate division Zixibacteria bacterium]|nr:NTP transferase domain-containing protein [candidate division Zixibacteria bacterium]
MHVVILCGGQGTRLREETQFRPKALVEVGGRPILWHIMKSYAQYGHHDFVLCLGYKGEMIKRYFLDYDTLQQDIRVTLGMSKAVTLLGQLEQEGWTVTCADTGTETPTGGRIHRIERYMSEGTFMVTYGDGVSDIDIDDLLRFHRKMGKIATVTGVRPISRFGELQVNRGVATAFAKGTHVSSGWIDGGFFVFERAIFDYLNDNAWLSGDIKAVEDGQNASTLQRLIEDHQLAVYEHDGFWACLDTPRDLEVLAELWKTGHADWKTWTG